MYNPVANVTHLILRGSALCDNGMKYRALILVEVLANAFLRMANYSVVYSKSTNQSVMDLNRTEDQILSNPKVVWCHPEHNYHSIVDRLRDWCQEFADGDTERPVDPMLTEAVAAPLLETADAFLSDEEFRMRMKYVPWLRDLTVPEYQTYFDASVAQLKVMAPDVVIGCANWEEAAQFLLNTVEIADAMGMQIRSLMRIRSMEVFQLENKTLSMGQMLKTLPPGKDTKAFTKMVANLVKNVLHEEPVLMNGTSGVRLYAPSAMVAVRIAYGCLRLARIPGLMEA